MSVVGAALTNLSQIWLRNVTANFGSPQCSQQCAAQHSMQAGTVRKFTGDKIVDIEDEEELTIGPDEINKATMSYMIAGAADDYHEYNEVSALPKEKPADIPRVFTAPTALPQDLRFVVPPKEHLIEGVGPRQRTVCVKGPHGPIMVELPEDAVPGEERTWRLGPYGQQVTVPEGVCEGSQIDCEIDGRDMKINVPAGKSPGDTFEVVPPALVVMIPKGSQAGDLLEFTGLNGELLKVPAPDGMKPGQYFSLLL